MKAKRLILSALITGLLMWGLTEFFAWIMEEIFGGPSALAATGVVRIAPALSGALFGISLSLMRQAIQKKREEMLSGEEGQEGSEQES